MDTDLVLIQKVLSLTKFISLKKIADESNIELIETNNLVDEIWLSRPKEPNGKVIRHEEKFSGKSFLEKKRRSNRRD
jgi:hypothetical protein